MTINHDPELEPRKPSEGDLEMYHNLEQGDEVTFFEWPVEPLTVLGREDDEQFGEHVRVKAAGDESFLYVVDGHIWHYAENDDAEANPYPVQNLVKVE
jgi:hypothetical protein